MKRGTRKHKIEINKDLYDKAIEFARNAHSGQLDKSGEVYFHHPMRVAQSLEHLGYEYAIVGVLHDTIEDTEVTYHDILENFGLDIAEAVYSVSRIESPKEIYHDFIERSKRNKIGKVVKIADIKDNMSPIRLEALPESERGIITRYQKALVQLESE